MLAPVKTPERLFSDYCYARRGQNFPRIWGYRFVFFFLWKYFIKLKGGIIGEKAKKETDTYYSIF